VDSSPLHAAQEDGFMSLIVSSIALVFSIVLPWSIVGLGCWLGYQLLRQNGRILLHLEALEQRLAQLSLAPSAAPAPAPSPPSGLPVGSAAPEFELPDLSGTRTALSQFRGRRLMLIFFNPGCGFCTRMAPDLATLPTDGDADRPLPLVVTTGEAEANRRLVQEHGIRCPVLLQEQMEVASQYQAHGTPMGYLIDEHGRIASEIAVGAQALLALAEGQASAAALNGNGRHAHRGNRSLADSNLSRNGLPAGTPAPLFRLPSLDGGELSLEQYLGWRVLLVFSDPHCGPCDQLAPQLECLFRCTPEVQVLMVSRGEVEANRAKLAEHGLTFPVLLQRQWEISREYAIFGTPIGYLIDEEGIIAADVAVGLEPILALCSRAAAQTNGKENVHRRGKKEAMHRC
jgi:peroxiredoxin